MLNKKLTVEIRDYESGVVLCTHQGDRDRIVVEGSWTTPGEAPLSGVEFCSPSLVAPPTSQQHQSDATLKVVCE